MDCKAIGFNRRGCMPIFYIQVTAKWKQRSGDKKFYPETSVKMVYKGPASGPEDATSAAKLKARFFKEAVKGEPGESMIKTFTITSFTLLHFMGYENDPGI